METSSQIDELVRSNSRNAAWIVKLKGDRAGAYNDVRHVRDGEGECDYDIADAV